MGYLLAILLLIFSPTSYQAQAVDCAEIAEVLDDAVEIGTIRQETRDRVVARCTKYYGE